MESDPDSIGGPADIYLYGLRPLCDCRADRSQGVLRSMGWIPPVPYNQKGSGSVDHEYHDIITAMRTLWNGHRVVASLAAFALSGCATLPGGRTKPHESLPSESASYYQYSRQPLEGKAESVDQRSGFRIQRMHLAPPHDSDFRPIRIDFYRSNRPGQLPVILISPILAGNDLYIREFASFYAARGLHAVIVYRPKEVFSADRDLKDIENHFRESIIQLRQTVDWLETQDNVDSQQIGSFSISLGAILTTILAAVEPRVRAHVLGLPAGHLCEIIVTSKDKTIRKRRRAYLEKQGWSQEEGLKQLKASIVSEPMAFAHSIDPENILIIVGLFDRVLGLNRSLDLWKAMGRPRLIVLPTGHYTAYLATPYLKIVTYSFLRRQLRLNSSSRSTR